MKKATFEEFCAHYQLNINLVSSHDQYQEYLEMLDFTNSLFSD